VKRTELVKGKEIFGAIQALDTGSKKAVVEALGIAEHIERASKAFYEKEAEKTNGSELETFFSFLVKEETMHLEKILELKKMLEIGDAEKIIFQHNTPPPAHLMDAGKDEITAMLYALWREKKAQEFYAEAAEKTSGAVKEFFSELAEFEGGHVALFEKYIEDTETDVDLMLG
jgi:rubrerythrin